MSFHWSVPISDDSRIGEARRAMARLARAVGLDETVSGRAAIITNELATNLARHAEDGMLLFAAIHVAGRPAVDVLAIDRGPGMADLARCLKDGFSTGGTPGTGLGSVRRLASEFDAWTARPGGTVVFARVQAAGAEPGAFTWGAVCLPAPREELCGDAWSVVEGAEGLAFLVADGLGHGALAAGASRAAVAVFAREPFAPPATVLARSHEHLRGTRGAAVAVGWVGTASRKLRYAGVGNIAGSLIDRQTALGRGLVSHNGTVGLEMRRVQEFDYDFPPTALLVLHSDGLKNRWSLEDHPGLSSKHPALIAGLLYRDFSRGTDDVTVLVARA